MTWLKLLLISTLLIACGSDGDNPVGWDEEDVLGEAEEDVTSAVYTFGIRHDRTQPNMRPLRAMSLLTTRRTIQTLRLSSPLATV